MVEEIRAGEWWWASSLGRAVRVQATRALWGVTTITVVDGNGQTHEFGPDDLRPVSSAGEEILSPAAIVHVAAGARLAHHLNQPDTLTAPFRTSLQPLPHQIKHLEDALSRETTRLLIADEVGLGKTITAGLILTELKHRGLADRILVLAPAGLVPQWIQELRQHFNLHLTPLFTDLSPTPESGRVWTQYDHVVTSYDAVKPLASRRGWSREKLQAYNANRFEGLLDAAWDVVVIDEAHRVAGATAGVARHGLATGLATVAPHLMLLTGTPHQGKVDHFHRLVQLLDADVFSTPETLTPQNLSRHLLRMEKRHAVTLEGEPLFVDRTTRLVVLLEKARATLHKRLYDEVTEYIRSGYAAAEKDTRNGLAFLMILVQRLLASSTSALEETLQKRLAFLSEGEAPPGEFTDDDLADPDTDLHLEAVEARSFGVKLERQMLERLLALIRECQGEGPDPKALHLLQLLREIQQREADPRTKFLIFTEFQGTQRMLVAFLERHGYSVVALNGSMALEGRLEAQKDFRGSAQVLVSTEAGGEGLNLQFCHTVVNYDLPWNPMRIEQRIGRVHRIGQQHPVTAYNLVLGGTVEHRVVEILGEKLARILGQLGIDKLSDVLDTPTVDAEVQKLYRNAVQDGPRDLERDVDGLVARLADQAKRARAEKSLRTEPLDLERIRKRLSEPVGYWMEQFAKTAKGSLPADLRRKETRAVLQSLAGWVPGVSIPAVVMGGLPASTDGTWTLWRVGLRDGTGAMMTHYQPVLITNGEVRAGLAAQQVWESLLAEAFDVADHVPWHEAEATFQSCAAAAEGVCRPTFEKLVRAHRERQAEAERRHRSSVEARRKAIEAIGLAEVRQHRLKKLQADHEAWSANHVRRQRVHPVLEPVIVAFVRGGRS